MLVLPGAVAVGGLAGFAFEEQQLADAFAGVDAAIGAGGVAELQGEMAFPAGFSGGGVHDDAEAGIGALAQADHGDVGRHPQQLQRHPQPVGMGGQDEVVAVVVVMERRRLQVGRVEPLRVHHRARHMPEDQELLGGEPQVVAVGGAAVAEHRRCAVLGIEVAHQLALERFEHARRSLFVDPAVALEHGVSSCGGAGSPGRPSPAGKPASLAP